MKNLINKKVLLTTVDWFFGSDGLQYKAVHGTLVSIKEAKETVGFTPNRAHANWYFEVGHMKIMGCQVMYIEEVDTVHFGEVEEKDRDQNGAFRHKRRSHIYKQP